MHVDTRSTCWEQACWALWISPSRTPSTRRGSTASVSLNISTEEKHSSFVMPDDLFLTSLLVLTTGSYVALIDTPQVANRGHNSVSPPSAFPHNSPLSTWEGGTYVIFNDMGEMFCCHTSTMLLSPWIVFFMINNWKQITLKENGKKLGLQFIPWIANYKPKADS